MHTLASMALSAGAMLTYTVIVVLGRKPWWDAQYVIPILGMILVGQGEIVLGTEEGDNKGMCESSIL